MRKRERRGGSASAGFSLIELMFALVITLIVSGAIYGLMGSGQTAFRREPEVSDRQQNIRVAMDLIQRDIETAGMGMGAFVQAFANQERDDKGDPTGPPLNDEGKDFPSVIYNGTGQFSDFLEILGNDGYCPSAHACRTDGVNVFFKQEIPKCYQFPALVYVGSESDPTKYGMKFAESRSQGAGSGSCNDPGGGGKGGGGPDPANSHLNFPPGKSYLNPPGGFCGNEAGNNLSCQLVINAQVFRYEIAADPADGVPCLWRSTLGSVNGANQTVHAPDPPFQMVARGIEDLQVEYLNGQGLGWQPSPGAVACAAAPCSVAEYNTIVRQVRVTLSARTIATKLAGESKSDQGQALRGQLTSVITPRAALTGLKGASPTPLWQ
jgi:prepilin-type N-terminal cleavage/methylation domain-containing protein